ncbi:MAG: hypothetical protein CMH53_04795 [Myxococcales bacterium]|nr:hypothetical protein [Myxococcales bacterium]
MTVGDKVRVRATMDARAISARQFALLRMTLGTIVGVYLIGLLVQLSVRSELVTSTPSASLSSYHLVMRSIEIPFGAGYQHQIAIAVLLIGFAGSVALTLGWCRRLASALLCVLWVGVIGAKGWAPISSWVSVALALLWTFGASRGEPLALSDTKAQWELAQGFHRLALVGLLGATSAVGCINVVTFSQGGTELMGFGWSLQVAQAGAGALAWSVIALQICALPLGLWATSQRWMWALLTAVQLVGLIVCDASWPCSAVLLLHMLSFDARWLPPVELAAQSCVVYFDGVCNLCNGAVDFIVAEDTAAQFRFAPIQGQMAASLQVEEVEQGRSLALQVDGRLALRTDAVCDIASGLGGHWRVLSYARWIPKPLRDALYDVIQRNRYAWFGQSQHCRVPTAAERDRFLP